MRRRLRDPVARAAKIAKAKRLRADGLDFAVIAKELGVTTTTAHGWIDPVFAQYRRDQINRNRRQNSSRRHVVRNHVVYSASGPSDAEIRRRLNDIPEDTRSLTGRLCGDPIPGRSA